MHIPRSQISIADALSRLPLPTTGGDSTDAIYNICSLKLDNMPVMAQDILEATKSDPVLSCVLRYVKSGWPVLVEDECLRPYFHRRHEITVERDCLLWGLRVIIPASLHSPILEELHQAHPGIIWMKEVARSDVWWPQFDDDIEATVRACASCQQKQPLPSVAPLTPWLWPSKQWQ